jgi:hypothetical protein
MISELLPPFSASLPPPSPLACRASTGLVAPTTRFTSPGSGDKPESSQVVFCPTGPKQEVADNVRREEVIRPVIVNDHTPPIRMAIDALTSFVFIELKPFLF